MSEKVSQYFLDFMYGVFILFIIFIGSILLFVTIFNVEPYWSNLQKETSIVVWVLIGAFFVGCGCAAITSENNKGEKKCQKKK